MQHYFFKETLSGQFFRYIIVGGLAFLLDLAVFSLCLYVVGLHYLLSNFFGLIIGLTFNYTMSILWVFQSCKRNFETKKITEFLLFTLVGFVGVGINQMLMYIMVDGVHMKEIISKIFAAIIVLIWNFGARKLMLFKKKKED
ncbi:Putative flippase GtrA (transmembrane translocase of bactoprenol-linked glucose) [Fibrobacter sp. UWB8]|uniref:GtrA family protein n=1 Tax=Fibrobacter sp. UWB8 TaxID=1896207 RepID=UPI0009172201|nr:GtrA family protein [Fibrobacter sp. UWB8]SHG37714.1 Putative flippase GtrA (transmembrane translocase of bactoprenol-linked glucose) [Fibrobacter sp. UWB8]